MGIILQKALGAHAGAVVQVRVHLPHVPKIAMCLVLFELLLFNAMFDAVHIKYQSSSFEFRGLLLPVVREFEVQKGETGGCEIIAGTRLCALHNLRNIMNESLHCHRSLHHGAGA